MPQKWLDPVQKGLPAPVAEAVSELRRIYEDGPFERLRQVEDAIVAARATTPGLVTVSAATCSRMLSPSRTELHKTALPRWPSVQAFLAVHGVDPGPFEPRWIAAREAWASRRDDPPAPTGLQETPTVPGLRKPGDGEESAVSSEPLGSPDSGRDTEASAPAGSATGISMLSAPDPEPADAGAALRCSSLAPVAGEAVRPVAGEAEPIAEAPVAIAPSRDTAVAGGKPAADLGLIAETASVPQPPPAIAWWRRPLVIGGLLLAALGLIVVGMLLGYLLARYQLAGLGPAGVEPPVACDPTAPESRAGTGLEVKTVCSQKVG